ncbi:unnamed protein product [Cylindrotheca closterium]|uniref:Uncharacterized protein n=1 Tax=Cylindrotheca closterium TaxID=2856 RepID=A0AAD2G7Q1_9STRA|nr:unnamed protein product [Cylindrotheca closterium]
MNLVLDEDVTCCVVNEDASSGVLCLGIFFAKGFLSSKLPLDHERLEKSFWEKVNYVVFQIGKLGKVGML